MESFFGHLKSEAFDSQKINKSIQTLRKIVARIIHHYNYVKINEIQPPIPKEF
ncbi:hypothetical protein CW304_01840 [Bacillus sp. UFRGS-B20]|nr:hypothetical protein CW304_01840 [Bacillus sp. UFRGS-B20]